MSADAFRILGILPILIGLTVILGESFGSPVMTPECTNPPCPTNYQAFEFTMGTPIGIILVAVGLVLMVASSKMKRAAGTPSDSAVDQLREAA